MHLTVAIEATTGDKPEAANVTNERAAGGVSLHVGIKCVTVGKSAATDGAAVLMAILVEGQVFLQLGSLSKGLEAVVASVRPLTSMSQQVGFEMRGVQETLATVVTSVGSL